MKPPGCETWPRRMLVRRKSRRGFVRRGGIGRCVHVRGFLPALVEPVGECCGEILHRLGVQRLAGVVEGIHEAQAVIAAREHHAIRRSRAACSTR